MSAKPKVHRGERDHVVGEYVGKSGRVKKLYMGPKGGTYCISKGKKVYVEHGKKKAAKPHKAHAKAHKKAAAMNMY